MNDLSIDISCPSIIFSIEALVEGIKPIVTEKCSFEYRDESLIMTPFNNWDLWNFDAKNKPENFCMNYFF